jgi:aspirochlorine biosynthesis cytochrome P450 monooxygenase
VREVKLIFTRLILEYDVKWEISPSERPPPFLVEGQFLPNMKQKVLLKRREAKTRECGS